MTLATPVQTSLTVANRTAAGLHVYDIHLEVRKSVLCVHEQLSWSSRIAHSLLMR
jgi:hypothetical protein